MAKLNLKYYNYNDLYVYSSLKNLDDLTCEYLKSFDTKKYEKQNNCFIDNLCDINRQNIFKGFDFNPKANLLEVNPGLGVLTEFLCDKVSSVTVLDFAKRNAEIISERLSDRKNLEIVVGDINNVKFRKKFDYIILNDILEFAVLFFIEDPYEKFINYFKDLLKPNGKLIFVVSNKFGIKSWAGVPSEHTLLKCDELNDYPNVPLLKSLSKDNLISLIEKSNFQNIDCYFPIPNSMVSKQCLTEESLNYLNPYLFRYDDFAFSAFIDTRFVIGDIKKQGEFPFFANSYLIFAYNNLPEKEMVYYSKIKNNVLTKFIKKDEIRYVKKYVKTLRKPKIKGINLLKYNKENDYYISEPLKGKSLYDIALEYLNNNDKDGFFNLLDEFIGIVKKMYPEIKDLTERCIKNSIRDLNFNNVYKFEDEYYIIEYDDLIKEEVPLNYIIFAGMYLLNEIKYDINIFSYLKNLGFTLEELNNYIVNYIAFMSE